MTAPEIAKTVRQMFETGQVVGRHEVKKTKGAELASESGVFENEPSTVVEGVVRSADYAASDVDQVASATVLSPHDAKCKCLMCSETDGYQTNKQLTTRDV